MIKDILSKSGLTKTQSETLAYLLEHGESKARDIAKNTQIPRGVVYKALDELLELDVVEKRDPEGKVSVFWPKHPSVIESLFENREKEVKKNKNAFFSVLPELVSAYNLSTQKPGVTYFEGDSGVERILEDTLTSNTDIYMYGDVETIVKSATEINESYGKKRKRMGIKKKILVPDTLFSRKYLENYNPEVTEVRFIPKDFFPFSTPSTLEIYDGKLSYLTITDKIKIGVLLHDRNLYLLQKQFFEFTWSVSKKFEELDSTSLKSN